MSDLRFIKYIPSEKARWLRKNYPNAYLLLSLIVERARRISGHIDGLQVGDAIIGDYEEAGLTRQQYRTAIEKLVEFNIIEIVYNGKKFLKREKSTIKITISGTLVRLIDSGIWDINSIDINQPSNQRATNEQPTSNHKEERNKNEEERKEEIHNDDQRVVNSDVIIPIDFKENSMLLASPVQHNVYYQTDNQSLTESKTTQITEFQENNIKKKSKPKAKPDQTDELMEKRKNVHISEKNHAKLIQDHGDELVNACYDYLSEWKNSKAECDPKAVKAHSDYYRIVKWVMKAVKEERLSSQKPLELNNDRNRRAADYISRTQFSKMFNINISSNRIEFVGTGSYSAVFDYVNFDDPNFDREVMHHLQKKRFQLKSNIA